MRSFDDLYNDIWRPQSIAFSYVIYGVSPSEADAVVPAYLAELARLRKELKNENPVLLALTRERSPGKIVE